MNSRAVAVWFAARAVAIYPIQRRAKDMYRTAIRDHRYGIYYYENFAGVRANCSVASVRERDGWGSGAQVRRALFAARLRG